jgi:hypothetical protein
VFRTSGSGCPGAGMMSSVAARSVMTAAYRTFGT